MIIGHEKQWQFLKKSAQSGKISHAYLFSGPEHLGKKKIALEFVKLINGAEINENHPDLILIAPQPGGEIQISQIKELIQKLSLKSYSAPFKCLILDKAHLMNQEAQNCFLKTLEEPKGKTLLILITESPEMLFPTIRSRCEIIKFFPVQKLEIENYLRSQGISEDEVQEIAELSLGRPGLAIDFISDPQKLENYQRVIKKLIEIPNLPLAGRFQYARELAKGSDLREILEIWLSYFRNILLSKLKTNQKLLTSDINRLREIQETNFLISTTNVNSRLALEILMLDL
jgi:DNA polymerase-3 subunit delta'